MKSSFFSLHLDSLGFFTSMLCAIHCAALPVVLAFTTLGSLSFLQSPVFEIAIVLLSFLFASWSLVQSYLKHHRRWRAILTVIIGFSFLILSHFMGTLAPWFMVLGGSTIALAHLLNWRLLKRVVKADL